MQVTIDIDEHTYAVANSKSIEQGVAIEEVLNQMLRDSFIPVETSCSDIPHVPNIKAAKRIRVDPPEADDLTYKNSL